MLSKVLLLSIGLATCIHNGPYAMDYDDEQPKQPHQTNFQQTPKFYTRGSYESIRNHAVKGLSKGVYFANDPELFALEKFSSKSINENKEIDDKLKIEMISSPLYIFYQEEDLIDFIGDLINKTKGGDADQDQSNDKKDSSEQLKARLLEKVKKSIFQKGYAFQPCAEYDEQLEKAKKEISEKGHASKPCAEYNEQIFLALYENEYEDAEPRLTSNFMAKLRHNLPAGIYNLQSSVDAEDFYVWEVASYQNTYNKTKQAEDLNLPLLAIDPEMVEIRVIEPNDFYYFKNFLDNERDIRPINQSSSSASSNISTNQNAKLTVGIDKVNPILQETASQRAKNLVSKVRQMAWAKKFVIDTMHMVSNQFTPEVGARFTKEIGQQFGAVVSDIVGEELKEKFFLASRVGAGSSKPTFVSHLKWTYKGDKPMKKLALAGKGVTYDTGGINVKTDENMKGMSGDKTGALTALVIAKYIMENNLPFDLDVLLGWVENMPDGNAMNMEEIWTVKGADGKDITLKNGHTDAEGRLVLIALHSYIANYIKPDLTMDFATLTGAQVISLGPDTSAYYSNNFDYGNWIKTCAYRVGDPLYKMPFNTRLLKKGIDADADYITYGGAYGGSIFPTVLMSKFVKGNYVHFDIASAIKGNHDHSPKYTGQGELMAYRTVIELLEDMSI